MITPRTLAHAWLLLAALALTTAGCSQLEDTPDAPSVATGNEPISISIAPKPGFQAGDAATRSIIQAEAQTRSNDAQTRSTVGDDGAFAWEGAEDFIFVVLTFSFADGTTAPLVKEQQWVSLPLGNSANTPVILNWEVIDGWAGTTKIKTPMTWPLGAKSCTVQAFHTNCGYNVAGDGSALNDFTYAKSGQGDHMIFKKTFNVGDELEVNFAHSTTRVTFKGLKPLTTYTLKPNSDAELLLPASFAKSTFSYDDDGTQPFTTDKDGTFTRCLPLTSFINATSGEVKINVFTADGTTHISEGTLQAQSTGGTPAWKTNGLQYIMTAKDFAGGTNPDNRPDLLPPPLIDPGATVYELNGYYITHPDVDPTKTYMWPAATAEDTNPCKKAGNGWRLPTMKDFEVMAGWTTSNPWKNSYDGIQRSITNAAAFNVIFPEGIYWSSESKTDNNINAWSLCVKTGTARYDFYPKNGDPYYLRCVQPMNP